MPDACMSGFVGEEADYMLNLPPAALPSVFVMSCLEREHEYFPRWMFEYVQTTHLIGGRGILQPHYHVKMESSSILRFNDANVWHNFSKDSNWSRYSLPAGIDTEQGLNNQFDVEMKKLCSCYPYQSLLLQRFVQSDHGDRSDLLLSITSVARIEQ